MLIDEGIKRGIVLLDTGVKYDEYVHIIAFEDNGQSYGKIQIGANSIIRCGAVICSGVSIGRDSLVGHNCILRVRSSIGDSSVVSHLVNIERDVSIGSGVRISAHTHLTGSCIVEDQVHIGANVATINDRNLERVTNLHAPIFRKGSRIGSSSTIMANVEIGNYSLVGASSLVLSNVPENTRVCGVPAVVMGEKHNG